MRFVSTGVIAKKRRTRQTTRHLFRRLPMVRALVLLAALAVFATPAGAAGRNIVLFVADDHGAEALGAYGNPVVRTPRIDEVAAEGVRFTHAFATTASCSASRSVLLSGVHNHRNGQFGHEHEYHRPFNHDAEDRVDPAKVIVPPWLPDIPEVREELALYYASVRKVDKAF